MKANKQTIRAKMQSMPAPVKKLMRIIEAGATPEQAKLIINQQYSFPDVDKYISAITAVQDGYNDL